MHFHDHYKDLCALALSGQLAQSEREELVEHLAACAECRIELGDFAQIASSFPTIADARRPVVLPDGLIDRLLARARSEGIPLSRKRETQATPRHPQRSRAVRLAFATFLAGIATSYVIARFLPAYHDALPVKTFAAAKLLQNSSVSSSSNGDAQARVLQENVELKEQLQLKQGDLAVLSAKVAADQGALRAAEAGKTQLNSFLAETKTSTAELRQRLLDSESEVAQLKTDFEKLKAAKEADAIAFQIEQNERAALRDQVAKLEVKLHESEQLSEEANEAKDLVVARKLHIVDVDDTDENGRKQRPFGRIFYAEGKSLKFYAYDLADPRKLNAKISFYVWGSKEGATKSVKNLGIFHSDDVNDRRWVLEFRDTQVLAQIDCVFVTAESDKKAVKQPTGKQILFASLGKSNHP